MAVLTDQQRQEVRNAVMRIQDKNIWDAVEGTKADLRAVVDAFDQYLEDNATAINQSIPAGPRAKFTPLQKAVIMAYVAIKRYGG